MIVESEVGFRAVIDQDIADHVTLIKSEIGGAAAGNVDVALQRATDNRHVRRRCILHIEQNAVASQ